MNSSFAEVSPISNGSFADTSGILILIIIIVAIAVILKGYALWVAARRGDKVWFIAILVINLVGILELVYLYFIAGKWHGSASDASLPPTSGSLPNAGSRG